MVTGKKAQALTIPKEIILNKIKGQNLFLKKYGLKQIDFLTLEKVNEIYDEAVEKFVNPKDNKFSTSLSKTFVKNWIQILNPI